MSLQISPERALKITFDADVEYAAFLHPDINNLTVISSRAVVDGDGSIDDGGGSIDDGRFAILVDGDGVVTDIEMWTQNVPTCPFPNLTPIIQLLGRVDVLVADPLLAMWAVDHGSSQAWISLSANLPTGSAVRLGGSGIVLSVSDGGLLEGLFINGIVVDPTCTFEKEWLDRFSTE